MVKPIGQIPVVESYLSQLSDLLYSPIRRGESAIFLWPVGSAKSFHLPRLLTNQEKQEQLGKLAQAQKFFYFDFLSDLEGNEESFKETLCLGLAGRKNSHPTHLRDIILSLLKKGEIVLVLNQLDSYELEELKKIIRLLDKIISLSPNRIHFSIHLKSADALKIFQDSFIQSPLCRNIINIPQSSESEAKQIIAYLAKNSGLVFTTSQINKLHSLSGSNILLIRTAIREIIKDPALKNHLALVSQTKEFQLKKQIIQNSTTNNESKSVQKISFDTLDLTKSERRILAQMEKSPNGFISREEVAQALWKDQSFENYSDWAIDKAISRLREKFFASGLSPTIISTIKRKGFSYDPAR